MSGFIPIFADWSKYKTLISRKDSSFYKTEGTYDQIKCKYQQDSHSA